MIPQSTQIPASPITPELSTASDVQTSQPPVPPELKQLQDSFADRLSLAKSELSKSPEAQQALTEALVDRFGIFRDSESDRENKENFLSIALAQCNLADQGGIEILQQVVSLQNQISAFIKKGGDSEGIQNEEHLLENLEKDLGSISRKDNNERSGSFTMGIERQGFVEQHVEEWFPEDLRQSVKDALILLKNQMTSGADIGPLPNFITELKFGTAEELAYFAIYCKSPNHFLFTKAGGEFLLKSGKLERHFVKNDQLSTVLAGKIPEDKMEKVIQALSRPVSEMSTEALVLAAIITPSSQENLKSYLKAAQVLSLKTQAQKDDPDLSDNTAVALALERSDAMVRGHYKSGAAAQSAADTLLKSLTPLPEDIAKMA
ncbi:hypothetical protein J7438_21865 [Thalassotalea sp. G20_0]|uniref:hypothetical protein n=1 Tax=Thalassotalea sp. G20_0 TaxID=2821093 RepID=UPI001ADCFA8B|nr:hypothetical protein [Thalassotalea sp. G20_0]MBO9496710.1 hypothetical protein [Thalassotalea sp. G20_0]